MTDFHAAAEKKMKEWKERAESNEKKVGNLMKSAVYEINSTKSDQNELKKKFMESQMKNARIAAENKQYAKNLDNMQQQLLSNRSAESTVISEAMRMIGLIKSSPIDPLDQSSSKDNGAN